MAKGSYEKMKQGRTRQILALILAVMLFSSGLTGVWTLAEEAAVEVPVAADERKEAAQTVPEQKKEETVSEPTQAAEKPAQTAAPAATLVAEPTSAPVEPVEDTTAAPADSEVPDAQPTQQPEATLEPLPTATDEVALDATVEPAPSEEPAPSLTMMKKSRASEYNHLNENRLIIPSDGMPIPQLYQYDYRKSVCIADGLYKSVATSGCGATAASMLIAYIAQNYDQTPYTLFYWAASHGYYVGNGLSIECVQKMLSSYGVSSRLEGVSADAIVSALKANRPIIMLMGEGSFTNNGHYIVLRGLDANGKVLVNDPSSSGRSSNTYAPEVIAREAKGGVMLVASAAKQKSEASASPEVEEAVQTIPTLAELENTMLVETTPAPQAVQTTENAVYSAQVCVDCVNLRSKIGTSGEIVAQLVYGARVEVMEEKTSSSGKLWCKVLYQGQEGYMRGDMLEKMD